jgi:ubiquinone/menaquinone biosynthesis C-methylase UbiE
VCSLKAQSREEFGSWAKTYDRSLLQFLLFDPSHKRIVEEIGQGRLLGDNGQVHILDIGCGTGKLPHRLISRHANARVFGIDLSESMLRAAPPHVVGQARIHLGVADSEHLPFAIDSFDFVTCSNSFHHYPNQLEALREMHRVLKPRGELFLIDGYRDNWFGWLIYDVAVTRCEGGRVHHASAREFRELFSAAGFTDVRQQIARFPAPTILTSGHAQKD